MKVLGPFDVSPRILQRSTGFTDLIVRNRPGTDMYRLWGAKNVNEAYGNIVGSGVGTIDPTAMMDVLRDTLGQSPTVVKRGWHIEESRRGQTSFQFDVEDYVVPAIPPPFRGDEYPVYIRLQENRAGQWLTVSGPVNHGKPILGPILAIPPAIFYGESVGGTMNMVGIAPAGTGCVQGQPPVVDLTLQVPPPMHIIFPKTITNILVSPQEAGKSVLMSFGLDDPMIEIQNTIPFTMDSSRGIHEIVIAADSVATMVTIHIVCAHVMN